VTVRQQQIKTTAWPALCMLILMGPAAHAQSEHPSDWLNRMAAAVQNTNYEGTVLRMQNGDYQALKVVHTVSDGVVRERVLIQEGNGLEIIRNGNEVHCILPDEKSVVIAEWDEQSTLFSTLPSADIRFGNEYDISIVREERVAGRKAALLAIRPHDNFRFGHKIWLDVETGFPLQTQLYAHDGTTIEEVKFADISLDKAIPASALAPSYSIENYRWFTQPSRAVGRLVESGWTNDGLPAGFRLISAKAEQLPVSDAPVTHLTYGDGLAEVSVFVAARVDDKVTQRTTKGALNTYGLDVGDFRVTAIGEVPAETVEQIATSMRRP
jgi:sigma-E factor negative regulatory protein RseB